MERTETAAVMVPAPAAVMGDRPRPSVFKRREANTCTLRDEQLVATLFFAFASCPHLFLLITHCLASASPVSLTFSNCEAA